jgi:hypothetical protein
MVRPGKKLSGHSRRAARPRPLAKKSVRLPIASSISRVGSREKIKWSSMGVAITVVTTAWATDDA